MVNQFRAEAYQCRVDMNAAEVDFILSELKKGKTYFKPLPYSDVEGGTTIGYEGEQQRFKEHYLNRSVYDRGCEDETRYLTEEELRSILLNSKHRDAQYLFGSISDTYELR